MKQFDAESFRIEGENPKILSKLAHNFFSSKTMNSEVQD